jgi:hypothetical protein
MSAAASFSLAIRHSHRTPPHRGLQGHHRHLRALPSDVMPQPTPDEWARMSTAELLDIGQRQGQGRDVTGAEFEFARRQLNAARETKKLTWLLLGLTVLLILISSAILYFAISGPLD